nr:MAG TPA: GidA associated domain [Caudoviricetes sp.]
MQLHRATSRSFCGVMVCNLTTKGRVYVCVSL